MTDHRLRSAVSRFLDACASSQMSFEPQRAYSTQGEAEEFAFEFAERLAELHRAIGKEPPAWPKQLSRNEGSLI